MSTISDPGNALQRLAHLLTEAEDPDDRGPLAEAGQDLLNVADVVAKKVRQTNKACKGEVIIRFRLKGYRTKNKEVAIEVEPEITNKKPNLAKSRGIQLFAGHDGELSTVPVQEEMPLFTKESAKAIEGGKVENIEGKKGKKAI